MHHLFIRRCLELAENGRGKVSPNPLVGCVIVSGGAVVTEGWFTSRRPAGEGWHEEFGGPHAEVVALRKAGELAKGAILYVNLEPCCAEGKQPPCTDAIVAVGIATVVFGARDPSNPGANVLRKNGISVVGPVLESECRRLNRGFFSLIEQGRPWVTLKKALTRDSQVATERVTSEEQDRWAHARLRATHDAILVGAGTVIADNPKLNVRFNLSPNTYHLRNLWKTRSDGSKTVANRSDFRIAAPDDAFFRGSLTPRRIILDPHDEIPKEATVLTDEDAARTLVIREKLPIPTLLLRLRDEGITSLLVEGGPKVWRSFEESGCVDEMVTLVGRSAPVAA